MAQSLLDADDYQELKNLYLNRIELIEDAIKLHGSLENLANEQKNVANQKLKRLVKKIDANAEQIDDLEYELTEFIFDGDFDDLEEQNQEKLSNSKQKTTFFRFGDIAQAIVISGLFYFIVTRIFPKFM